MIYRNLHHQRTQLIEQLPNFLRVLHKNQNQSAFSTSEQPDHIHQNLTNRFCIVEQQSTRDSQIYQILIDSKEQCRKILFKIQELKRKTDSIEFLYHIERYIEILTKIEDQNQIIKLIEMLNVQYKHIESVLKSLPNKLVSSLFQQKHYKISQSFQSLLIHIKQLLNKIKISQSNLANSFILSNNIKYYLSKLLKLSQQQYWISRESKNFMRILVQAQNFVILTYQEKRFCELDDIMVDFLLRVINSINESLALDLFVRDMLCNHNLKLQSQISNQLLTQSLKNFDWYKFLVPQKDFVVCPSKSKKNKRLLLRQLIKGVPVKRLCNFCNYPLQEQQSIIIYQCKHKFHSYCDSGQYFCLECSYVSDEYIFEKVMFDQPSIKLSKSQEKQNKIRDIKRKHDVIEQEKFIKEQKLFYQKRKLKLFDYQVYGQQKFTLNMMHMYDDKQKFN